MFAAAAVPVAVVLAVAAVLATIIIGAISTTIQSNMTMNKLHPPCNLLLQHFQLLPLDTTSTIITTIATTIIMILNIALDTIIGD